MARIELPQSWLPDLVIDAKQQAPQDMERQAAIIGRSVGELIERLWREDSHRCTNVLAVVSAAVKADNIRA